MSVRVTTFIVVVILLGASLAPLASSSRVKAFLRDALAPVQQGATTAFDRGRMAIRLLNPRTPGFETRRDLRQRIAELELELARSREAADGYQDLRRQLRYRDASPHDLLPAEVIARGDSAGWWTIIRINRGEREGVATNAPVMTEDGVVGMVRATTPHTAEVLLLTDRRMRLGCRVRETGITGILRGMGPGGDDSDGESDLMSLAMPLWMEYIPPGAAVTNGAIVETSGMGGVFPAGLTIGTVQRAHTDASQLFLRADVAPAADMRLMRHVFVLRRAGEEDEP